MNVPAVSFKQRLGVHIRDLFTCTYCQKAMQPLSDDLCLAFDDGELLTVCRTCKPHEVSYDGWPGWMEPPMLADGVSVLEDVAEQFQVPLQAILGKRRIASLVDVRREIIQRLYNQDWPISAIARLLHRNHSTVIHHLETLLPTGRKG